MGELPPVPEGLERADQQRNVNWLTPAYEELQREVASLRRQLEERERLRELCLELAEAHRRVIAGVTPKHPEWCAGTDQEDYSARFSRWHTATRAIRAELGLGQHAETDRASRQQDQCPAGGDERGRDEA